MDTTGTKNCKSLIQTYANTDEFVAEFHEEIKNEVWRKVELDTKGNDLIV